MSSAMFPLGMNSMPASGYNHGSTYYNKSYQSWKTGNPTGTVPQNIRPLTNMDTGNVFPTGMGLPRPIKHYRKGRNLGALGSGGGYSWEYGGGTNDPEEASQIAYNLQRSVRSSTQGALVHDTLDIPGGVSQGGDHNGIQWVSDYKPNPSYVTQHPQQHQKPSFCCNEERKARIRSRYASTNIKPNYYTSHEQYLKNRCQTYDQREFNFIPGIVKNQNQNQEETNAATFSLHSSYNANCYPNAGASHETEAILVQQVLAQMAAANIDIGKAPTTSLVELEQWIQQSSDPNPSVINIWNEFLSNPYTGLPLAGPTAVTCPKVIYKPNNFQYATQGAVSSSSRNLRLNMNTMQSAWQLPSTKNKVSKPPSSCASSSSASSSSASSSPNIRGLASFSS